MPPLGYVPPLGNVNPIGNGPPLGNSVLRIYPFFDLSQSIGRLLARSSPQLNAVQYLKDRNPRIPLPSISHLDHYHEPRTLVSDF